jgi:putative transposase
MPKGLVRYQKSGNFHFITFSCYRRLPLLGERAAYKTFESELEAVRRRYGFVVAGYVLMPEHVHLLVGEPLVSSLSVALQVLKQKTSRKLKKIGDLPFWQRRYYDFNVHSELKRVEKLRYMHRNPGSPAHELCALGWKPVNRGLVETPEDWPWSSFVHYATGAAGAVEIESEWTAQRSEANKMPVSGQLCSPPFANCAKNGAPAPACW